MGNSIKKTDLAAIEQLYNNKMKLRLRKKFKTIQGTATPTGAMEEECYQGPGSQNTMYMAKVNFCRKLLSERGVYFKLKKIKFLLVSIHEFF